MFCQIADEADLQLFYCTSSLSAQGSFVSTIDVHCRSVTAEKLSMVIRAAKIEDLQQVKEIDLLLFQEESYPVFALRQLLDITNGLMKVVESGKKIVGYAIGHYNSEKQEAWFLSLGILPGYRGRKIGESLTADLIEEVKAMGATSINLTVHPENKPGISMYEGVGFESKKKQLPIITWTNRPGLLW